MPALLIVESPTKARTIQKFLGREYAVISSFGHIRDLPERKMGVDVDHDFEPEYVVPTDKKEKVQALKEAAKKATEVYLATDEDREGEAIGWHIAEVLHLDPEKAKRITFHEITKAAIERALKASRHLDMKLVDAQQTRRILDRLVGYELSPLLWKKIRRGLSAGRVQSVTVRLVVERERERLAFKKDEYWTIDATHDLKGNTLESKLVAVDGKKLDKLDINDEATAKAHTDGIKAASFTIAALEKKTVTRKAPTPLTTSLLQQEGSNRLGMGAKQTMTLAQKLYETGRITYMRTDSLNLSAEFIDATQEFVKKTYGDKYANGGVAYKTNKKGAQEAHEAIRPTDVHATPESLKNVLEPGMWKLYNLIWRRTVASQLPAAKVERSSIDLTGGAYTLRANGSIVVFDGFLKVWHSSEDKILPDVKQGDNVGTPATVTPAQHFTEPPPRYSDATLVKALEEHGIGRPSTYAPTIATIEAREYVLRDDNKRLYPSEIAMIVNDFLVEHFPHVVDLAFTANMEKLLDDIADGETHGKTVLHSFYEAFHTAIKEKNKDVERVVTTKEREIGTDPETGRLIKAKTGRFGPYVEVVVPEGSEEKPRRASLAKTANIEETTLAEALAALLFPRLLGQHPETKEDIIVAKGPYGPYLKCGKTNVALGEEHDPAAITLEGAIKLCTDGIAAKKRASEPLRTLGTDPENNATIVVKDGRYGAYVTDGVVNATIPKSNSPETITLEEALKLLATKRKRGGGGRGRRPVRTAKKAAKKS